VLCFAQQGREGPVETAPQSAPRPLTRTPARPQVQEPRRICYQGEHPGLGYLYSGIPLVPTPFSPVVLRVLAKVNELFPNQPAFNTVLLNYYENGLRPGQLSN
jgi:hypothetical protein